MVAVRKSPWVSTVMQKPSGAQDTEVRSLLLLESMSPESLQLPPLYLVLYAWPLLATSAQ